MQWAIKTEGLSKSYGDINAVKDLSLQVNQGEIYAFLGLNGAGKTTTIRMLLGMIRPSSGTASVLGTPVQLGSSKPWAEVGQMVEIPHAYPELSVRENLEVARRLHPGISPLAVEEIIEQLGLTEYAERRAGKLSLGNAQRLGLAKALLHQPSILILDEPANGLDPKGIVEVRQLLHHLCQEKGVTVFISSHILAEVARLAQRIGIIHQGQLLMELEIDEIERNRRKQLLLRTADQLRARAALEKAAYTCHILDDGMLQLLQPAAIQQPEQVASLLMAAGTPPSHLVVEQENLEDYFLRLVSTTGVIQ